MNKSIFTFRPHLEGHLSPEPNLKEVVLRYYAVHYNPEETEFFTNAYFEAFAKQYPEDIAVTPQAINCAWWDFWNKHSTKQAFEEVVTQLLKGK